MRTLTKVSTAAIAAAGFAVLAAPSYGFDFSIVPMKGSHGGPPVIIGGGGGTPGCFDGGPGNYCWMDGAVSISGLSGAGGADLGSAITMTFVDDFSSGNTLTGNFTGISQTMEHGKFTAEEASSIAIGQRFNSDTPFAGNGSYNYIQAHDFTNESALTFNGMFNVVNASYGLVGSAKQGINWSQYPTENSLIQAANGTALISKAAGNDGVAIGSVVHGKVDYLATGLKGGTTVIYVGALNWSGPFTSTNGSTDPTYGLPTTTLASYSDYPGSDPYYQTHFLAVPVDTADTGLAGTSFAAPVITAYAALIAQKFSASTPNLVTATTVTNQLLSTAVKTAFTDGYSAAKYGQGEACLACALSPSTYLQ